MNQNSHLNKLDEVKGNLTRLMFSLALSDIALKAPKATGNSQMSQNRYITTLDQVAGEFVRLMILYWDMLERPPLSLFLAALPMDVVFEHINKTIELDETSEAL